MTTEVNIKPDTESVKLEGLAEQFVSLFLRGINTKALVRGKIGFRYLQRSIAEAFKAGYKTSKLAVALAGVPNEQKKDSTPS